MPIRRLWLTPAENDEHNARLVRLRKAGVDTGNAGDVVPKPNRFTLEQVWHDFARVYELLFGEIAVVVFARLTVFKSGVMITDRALYTALDDFPLELDDPEEHRLYNELIRSSPHWPPRGLNSCLTGGAPLPRGRHEGMIVATGWSTVPAKCHDEMPVNIELALEDEQGNELWFKFRARVDRSVKNVCERRLEKRWEALRSKKRADITSTQCEPSDRKDVPAKETAISPQGCDEVHTGDKPGTPKR